MNLLLRGQRQTLCPQASLQFGSKRQQRISGIKTFLRFRWAESNAGPWIATVDSEVFNANELKTRHGRLHPFIAVFELP